MLLAFKVGLPQRPSEKNGQKGRVRSQPVPSLVPMPAQTAAKMRGSPPTAPECSAETDSLLEEAGFEPTVPCETGYISRPFSCLPERPLSARCTR